MVAIQRILVPIDFSAASQAALDYAAMLARKLGAELAVLHVWQPPFELGPFVGGFAIEDPDDGTSKTLSQYVADQAQRALDHAMADLRTATDVTVNGMLDEGPAKRRIVERAHEDGYDLVVMGTHGRTGLSRLMMGSVAEWVVRHAAVPVVTVPMPEAAKADSD